MLTAHLHTHTPQQGVYPGEVFSAEMLMKVRPQALQARHIITFYWLGVVRGCGHMQAQDAGHLGNPNVRRDLVLRFDEAVIDVSACKVSMPAVYPRLCTTLTLL